MERKNSELLYKNIMGWIIFIRGLRVWIIEAKLVLLPTEHVRNIYHGKNMENLLALFLQGAAEHRFAKKLEQEDICVSNVGKR